MKISLTVSDQDLPSNTQIYDSCDILFVTQGYSEELKKKTKERWPTKVVELKYIFESGNIVYYLETGVFPINNWGVADEDFQKELVTIRACLPKNTEIEVIDFNTTFFGRPSKTIIIRED